MRVGILIIGSLFWGNDRRKAWRLSHLRPSQAMRVTAPIYYGRLSKSSTFTMTFGTERLNGQGILVPCSTVARGFDDLLVEGEALWRAEDPKAAEHDLGKSWGCVGALFRTPGVHECETTWKNYFPTKCNAVPPVFPHGILRIAWPLETLSRKPADVDVILGTATNAQSVAPTPEAVADAWILQSKGKERYFFENIRCGIRTADDQMIWHRIEHEAPAWLENEEYSEAIKILRAETQR